MSAAATEPTDRRANGSSGSSRPRAPSARSSATSASRWRTAPAARRPRALIEGLLAPAFGIDELADAATVGDIALTTDSFVVKPLRFPGGSIGELAVNGTVNDLAVAGAQPLALSLSLILEEGLEADVLRAEVEAIAAAASAAGVRIVTGDTKVVERGAADQLYICTTGVGRRDPRAALSPSALQPGDVLLVSGRIGDHGTAIMLARGEFELGAEIESDTRSLWPAVDALLDAAGPGLRCLRDATRGGVASVLNELARASGVAMLVREAAVPVHPAVAGAAEILGIDPMHVANEGVLVAAVAPAQADAALAALRATAGGEQAAVIGEVQDGARRDGARGDRLRRQARDGPARRRSAPADLLRGAVMAATEFAPNQSQTEAITAHVLWMTVGPLLRRGLGRHDLRDEPEPRGHHHRRDPRACRRSSSTTRCSPTRTARTTCRPGTTPSRASSTRSS